MTPLFQALSALSNLASLFAFNAGKLECIKVVVVDALLSLICYGALGRRYTENRGDLAKANARRS